MPSGAPVAGEVEASIDGCVDLNFRSTQLELKCPSDKLLVSELDHEYPPDIFFTMPTKL